VDTIVAVQVIKAYGEKEVEINAFLSSVLREVRGLIYAPAAPPPPSPSSKEEIFIGP
jgi:hypothetical protein